MAKKARRPAEKKTPREPRQRLSAASVDYIEFAKALERHIQRKLPDTSEFLDYTQHLNDLQLALAKIASHFSKQLEADLLNLASRTLRASAHAAGGAQRDRRTRTPDTRNLILKSKYLLNR